MRIERTYIALALEAERLRAQGAACGDSLEAIVHQQSEILMLLAPCLDSGTSCVLYRGRILTPDPVLSSTEDEKRLKKVCSGG